METKAVAVRAQVIELAAVAGLLVLLCLVCPIIQFNNQFIIGPVVNCTLIYTGVRLRGGLKTAGIICLPSACTLTLGLLGFGGIYAMYMLPFIWTGNLALVLGFRFLSKRNYLTAAVLSVPVKAALIFFGYYLLLAVGLIPAGSPVAQVMWSAMGVYQLITAAAGAVLAYGALRLRR